MRRTWIYLCVLGVCLAAPADKALPPEKKISNEVEQLDELKNEKEHRNLEFMNAEQTQVLNVNGHKAEKTEKEKMVLSDGKVVASSKQTVSTDQDVIDKKPHTVSKTQIDVPDLGIHQTSVSDSSSEDKPEQEKKSNWEGSLPSKERNEEFYRKYAGVKYTPADLADYIMRTGDEESVALAIEELLREGIFTRAEAISYLQEVKNVRDYMRNFYQRSERDKEVRNDGTVTVQQATTKVPNQTKESSENKIKMTEDTDSSSRAKKLLFKQPDPDVSSLTLDRSKVDYRPYSRQDEVDVDDVLEKMRTASSMREEYTLEEIIFQLSKDMFAQSLLRGDPTAEESLTKIATFLESEVLNNRISRETEQRILDIVSAALIETLKEFPGLLRENPVYQVERETSYGQPLSIDHNIERRTNNDAQAKVVNPSRRSATTNNASGKEKGDSQQKPTKEAGQTA